MSAAREGVLAAVRASLAADPAARAELERPLPEPDPTALGAPADLDSAEKLRARFVELLESVGGRVTLARSEAEAAAALAELLAESGLRRVAVSDDPLVRRLVARAGELASAGAATAASAGAESAEPLTVLERPEERARLLDCELGVTGAQHGIAETGTLVLLGDAERHRLVSLVPPVHVAVLRVERILATLEDALAAVRGAGPAGPSRAITLVTGPSRTGDIELTLVVGVHGPRELHVILLAAEG